tara:strand:- start:96 stop:377 length:282 start_codon:yes stop_codon:yes gene_type:complete
MAVGDVVNVLSAATTILNYQPAAGVEIMVSSIIRGGTNVANGLYNGAVWAYDTAAASDTGMLNQKLFITNSIYIRINAAGGGGITSISGIQIK